MKRKKREMDEGLILRLLQEGYDGGIRKIGLFMNGEPFVTQKLSGYIATAKQMGYQYVYITTNGALASEEKLRSCVEAGMDSIKFSINGGSRGTYKIVHQRDDYDKVIHNLKYLYEYRKRNNLHFKILSSFVVTKYTYEEIEIHYQNIEPYVDELVFFNAESFAGQMEENSTDFRVEVGDSKFLRHTLQNQAPCKALWNSINVTCEGYLTLCCSEAFNYLVTEDLNEMSLKDAWHSERMAVMRKRHLKNELVGTQCGKCLGCMEKDVRPLNPELYERSIGN